MLKKESQALASLAKLRDKTLAVSFSGGKDSLVALDLAYRSGIKQVVFCDTSIEFDETLDYVKSIEQFYGIKIHVVTAPVSFFSMIDHVGIPSRRLRWCCEVFKFGPLARYAINNRLYGFITGLRKAESNRRVNYKEVDANPLVPVRQINPILEWEDKEVWTYIKRYNLPVNPLYQWFSRIGCWCCPYRTDSEWARIKELFPWKVKRFEKKLLEFAQKIKIKDKQRFIKGRGWTEWAGPLRKISVGVYSPCQSGETLDLIFNAESDDQICRIERLLPILTDNYFRVGKKLRVTVNNINKQKLNILVEKALNCRACGACLTLCKVGALNVDDKSVYIDTRKCIKCQDCIKSSSSFMRGACIVRNYSPRRRALIELSQF